jgi:tagaturonate epimerase
MPLGALTALLDDFHARERLHVTYGSALAQFGVELKAILCKHEYVYCEGSKAHFDKHLSLLK